MDTSQAPQLTIRLADDRKKALKAEDAQNGSVQTPPAAAASGGAAQLLSTQSSTDMLPCGLFEDELHELDELIQSHSPKTASLTEAAQLE